MWPDLAAVATQVDEEVNRDRRALDKRKWRGDPSSFFVDAFGVTPWHRQEEVLCSVRDYKRTAVRSGHKVSKSNSAAGAGMWWLYTRPQGRVITLATTGAQIKNIIWREVRDLWRRSQKIGRVNLPRPAIMPTTGMSYPDGRQFIGISAESTEGLSGLSGPDMLFIVDEASGVHEDLFVAIRGNMAGGASLLLISNPSQQSGAFYDAFNDHASLYNTIHISSEESPNILSCTDDEVIGVPEEEVIPGLALASYIIESRIEYGPDWQNNPLYHIRVKGNFPLQSAMCVIGAATVESGSAGWAFAEVSEECDLHFGVDVAHFGDDETSLSIRRGLKVTELVAVHGFSERRSSYMVAQAIRRHWKLGEPRVKIKIDQGGGYGSELASRLRDPEDKCWTHDLVEVDGKYVWELREEPNAWGDGPAPIEVYEVNVATKSTVINNQTGEPEYVNLRSQIWFGIDEFLKSGGTIPPDKRLHTELVTPRYEMKKNKRQVEGKKEIKKRMGHSPDRADSLALCIYEPEDLEVDHPEEEVADVRFGGERGY